MSLKLDPEHKISANGRYFHNKFKSWDEMKAEKADVIKKCVGNTQIVMSTLTPNLDQEFIDYIASFVEYVLKQYNPDIVETNDFRGSIYVGIGGFSILFLRIIQIMDHYNNIKENDDNKEQHTDDNDIEMKEHINKSKYEISQWNILMAKLCKISNTKNKEELRRFLLDSILKYNNCSWNDFKHTQKLRYSFLEGLAGAYGIRIVYYFLMKNDEKMNKYIHKLKDLSQEVHKLDAMELLYGRVGFVSTFLFIHQFIGNYNNLNLLECDQVTSICQSVIESGKQYLSLVNDASTTQFLKQNNIPLMWEWHESAYFGGAHGVAGILSVLISIPSVLNKNKEILKEMLDCCQSFTFKSGNFASSIRGYYKQRDSLVQLCHGATGFVPMYVTANKVLNNDEYVKYAMEAQQVIWERGLLTKGPGLCHGIGGNGYTFLSLYRHNVKELKYLYRAMQFARFIVDKNTKYPRKPDRPNSLFEGKAGGVIYVLDTLFASQTATFPCYEWV